MSAEADQGCLSHWEQQVADWVVAACELEVLSPKPGNVSPNLSFSNMSVQDFVLSAQAIAPVLACAAVQPLGVTVLEAVEATRRVVECNTNLGIILLLAPLAAVPKGVSLAMGISDVLHRTTVFDSRLVYQAIQLAEPSGLGKVEDQDIREEPQLTLLKCMELAADRDRIAAQYANGFQDVLQTGLPWFVDNLKSCQSPKHAVTRLALQLLAEFGDSLIARKCGPETSDLARIKARSVLASDMREYDAFDLWLRADGNQRNPGTTADLVAAVLFAAHRERL